MEYEFRPLGKKCTGTGADLVPGSMCHSVLVERLGGFERLDFSEAGWKGMPEGAVGSWKCQVPKAAEVRKKALDTATLFTHFEQMIEAANPAQENLRYILALYLLQKRKLKADGSRQQGDEEYLQFSGMDGEGPYEVRDPHLNEVEMQKLQQELNAYLGGEFA